MVDAPWQINSLNPCHPASGGFAFGLKVRTSTVVYIYIKKTMVNSSKLCQKNNQSFIVIIQVEQMKLRQGWNHFEA
jgi:hypothetical protein